MNILSDLCFGGAYTDGHSLRNKQTLFKEPIINPWMIHVDVDRKQQNSVKQLSLN